jgi:RNA polymerase sigma factor (sigma-70 family)
MLIIHDFFVTGQLLMTFTPHIHQRLMKDEELVQLCLKKDRVAEKALYDRFAGQMFAICVRYMRNRQEAEDVFQEGMIKVYSKLGTWQGSGPLGGWMRRVFIHMSLNQIKAQRKKLFSDIENISEPDNDLPNALDDMSAAEILTTIHQLPLGYKTVFNLFAIEGYSHAEIAAELGVSESTSKTQFLKAKAKLKTLITGNKKQETIDEYLER